MMEAGTPEQVDLQPVGTGPFQLIANQKDAVIRYKAHPDYWQGKATIDNLIFSITSDTSVAYQKLKADECDLIPYPNPADLKAMESDPDINLMQQTAFNFENMTIKHQHHPSTMPTVPSERNMADNTQDNTKT